MIWSIIKIQHKYKYRFPEPLFSIDLSYSYSQIRLTGYSSLAYSFVCGNTTELTDIVLQLKWCFQMVTKNVYGGNKRKCAILRAGMEQKCKSVGALRLVLCYSVAVSSPNCGSVFCKTASGSSPLSLDISLWITHKYSADFLFLYLRYLWPVSESTKSILIHQSSHIVFT